MNFSGLLGSALAGMGSGAMVSLAEQEKERLLQQKEDAAITLRQMLLDSRLAGGGSGSGGGRGGQGPLSSRVAADPTTVGWQDAPTDRAAFTTNEITGWAGNDPGGMLSDPTVMGPPQEGYEGSFTTKPSFDQVGYNKAEETRQSKNRDILTQVEQPDKYDDKKKGEALDLINKQLRAALDEKDPKKREKLIQEAAELSAATKGEGRYKVQGDTMVDTIYGTGQTTEVGKAKIGHENASAAKAGRESPKDETRAEKALASASKATSEALADLNTARDKAAKAVPKLSALDAVDQQKVAAYEAKVAGMVDNNPTVQAAQKLYEERRAQEQKSRERFNALLEPTKPEPKATLQSLPAGAKQIGTSGGRPVYQLPDGRKVIQQ